MKYFLLSLALLVLTENMAGQDIVAQINWQVAFSLPDVPPTSRNVPRDSGGKIKKYPALKVQSPELNGEVQSKQHPTSSSDLEPWLNSFVPHPYVMVGPSLMGGGYAVVAYRAETGFHIENRQCVMKGIAAYDNGHMVKDADQPNPKGHDRYLESAIYFRPPIAFLSGHWFIGGGFRWSQLSTTNYTKDGSRPQSGGGYDLAIRACPDCRRKFSMRIALDWITAGSDWKNGSHGPQIAFSLPSLRERRHWFWQQRLGIYRFHDTVTDRGNFSLTRQEQSQKHFDSFLEFGVVYRF